MMYIYMARDSLSQQMLNLDSGIGKGEDKNWTPMKELHPYTDRA